MIRLCEPRFDATDRARIDEVLASGMLVQGRMVEALEERVAARISRHAIANSNGTAALHLAMANAGIGAGDEVIVPAFTWPSAASIAQLLGATCRFVDVDPESFHLDVAQLAEALTPRTRAIVAIHQFGIPAPMERICAFAQQQGLLVIEDAACAIGSIVDGREAGCWGDYATFSFHPRKVVTTGEGGVVACGDDARAEALRELRNHGQRAGHGWLRFAAAGFNYRLPELSAALALGQLDRLDATLTDRRARAAVMADALDAIDGVHVPAGVRNPGNNVQSFVARLAPSIARDAFLPALRAQGVECTIGTYAVPQQPAFGGAAPDAFPVSWSAMNELVTLPLHEAMSDEDVAEVPRAVERALAEVRR